MTTRTLKKPSPRIARGRPSDARAWLRQGPTLAELRDAYPAEWQIVERDLAALATQGADQIAAYVAELSVPLPAVRNQFGSAHAQDAMLLSLQVRRLMAATALKTLSFAAATGVGHGRVRFNLLNGYLAQKLLFAHGLERKPVSLFWYRVIWPLLRQRRLLMPLVQPQGIYCFYSRQLIRELAAMIGDRRCLEIAAGDGTLSRFLTDAGVSMTATDDHSWQRDIRYPPSVVRQDARAALREQKPDVVVCSWPPAGNTFERHVFTTASVQLYITINGGNEHVSANHADYTAQTSFDLHEPPHLSRLVLPHQLDAKVQVFRRKTVTR